MNWRALKVGDKVIWVVKDEFDSRVKPCGIEVEVTEVCEDHILAEGDGLRTWIDDDTCEQFEKVEV